MSDATHTTQPQRVQQVCAHCGSNDVLADAFASWSVEDQRWEVAHVMDKGHTCGECDDETRLEEKPLSEAEQLAPAPPVVLGSPVADEDGTVVYLNARTDDEIAEVPRYAVLRVTPALLDRLRSLRNHVIAHGLAEAIVWGYAERWGGRGSLLVDEQWRTEADQIAVAADGFYLRCYLKHTTVMVETEFLGIDELADGIAEGKTIFGDLEAEEIEEQPETEEA